MPSLHGLIDSFLHGQSCAAALLERAVFFSVDCRERALVRGSGSISGFGRFKSMATWCYSEWIDGLALWNDSKKRIIPI